MNTRDLPCALIGAGRAGGALAIALHNAGYRFDTIVSKDPTDAERLATKVDARQYGVNIALLPPVNGLIFVTVPDSEISPVADAIAAAGKIVPDATIAVHLSGALGSDIMKSMREKHASTLAFHPAQTFAAGIEDRSVFEDIYFDLEGDERACQAGHSLAQDLHAHALEMSPEQRVLLHAAMTVTSNYSAVLLEIAESLAAGADCDIETAKALLRPLAKKSIANCFESSPGQALTGPAARGDIEVIERHLEVIDAIDKNYGDAYRILGQIAGAIANKRGSISRETLSELKNTLGRPGKENG